MLTRGVAVVCARRQGLDKRMTDRNPEGAGLDDVPALGVHEVRSDPS
jgi:hypothetical protein